jgi:hypothetical protein
MQPALHVTQAVSITLSHYAASPLLIFDPEHRPGTQHSFSNSLHNSAQRRPRWMAALFADRCALRRAHCIHPIDDAHNRAA